MKSFLTALPYHVTYRAWIMSISNTVHNDMSNSQLALLPFTTGLEVYI